ncbi:hypothetical protein GCM10020295_79320 [Streptomyces cinereospinus]
MPEVASTARSRTRRGSMPGQGLAAGGRHGGPPLLRVLLVPHAVPAAGERAGRGGQQAAGAVQGDRAGALGAQVQSEVDGVGGTVRQT